MNLHILPDSKFSNTFFKNLAELGAVNNNKCVVRTNASSLKYVKHSLPFAPLYSRNFASLVGDTSTYENVFIHQLSPLMYRWLALHSFQKLHWMIWGTDLYTLPGISRSLYEPLTASFVKGIRSRDLLLYWLKVYLTNMVFKRKAYAKINSILTWMSSEYSFATSNLPLQGAAHEFFFYENDIPYEQLEALRANRQKGKRLVLIVGNSGTPTNNHLDAIKCIAESGVEADIILPVSYGDSSYINFLKASLDFYQNGEVKFVDKFMPFDEYIGFLQSADALVMNHIRPQGYGNIFMTMYLGIPVLLNKNNISLPDLRSMGIKFLELTHDSLHQIRGELENKSAIRNALSHERLLMIYKTLFSR